MNHAEPARSGVVAAIGALNGDFPNGAKGTELEIDHLRDTNRDLSTILADLREWMSVAGMAVEKDVDMLFVLKGRFDALGASNRELVEAVKEQQIRLTDMFRRWELPTYRDPASAGSDLTLMLAAGRLAIDRAKVSG